MSALFGAFVGITDKARRNQRPLLLPKVADVFARICEKDDKA